MANKKSKRRVSDPALKLTSSILAGQVKEFLKNGGEIQHIPQGKSGYANLVKTHTAWSRPKPENAT